MTISHRDGAPVGTDRPSWRFENGSDASPVYFDGSRGPLFGWWHRPPTAVRAPVAVVLVAPLAYEYVYTHRTMRYVAGHLASLGCSVLRYDHLATGNSPGADGDPDLVDAWCADVAAAVAAVRGWSGASRTVVIGLRAGALLALAAARSASPIADALVLWCTPASGRAYTRELRAASVIYGDGPPPPPAPDGADAASIDVAGFSFSAEVVRQLSAIRLGALTQCPAPRVLCIERDDTRPDDALVAHLEALGASVHRERLRGYREMMVEPLLSEYPRDMIARLVAWVDDVPPSESGASRADIPVDPSPSVTLDRGAIAIREFPVIIDADRRLFGVVTRVAGETTGERRRPRTGVILLNTGGDHHVGPGRLYVELARELATHGCLTLRLDLHGLGDAALLDDDAPPDAYPIEAAGDVEAAVAILRGEYGVHDVIVGGICSGAYHAIEAARRGLPIAGVIAVNPQLYYERSVGTRARGQEHERFVQALVDLERVSRRDRLRQRLRHQKRQAASLISRYLVPIADRCFSGARRVLGRPGGPQTTFLDPACKTLLVFSAGDPGLYFLETRAPLQLARVRANRNCEFAIIENADHTFTPRASARALRDLILRFVCTRFERA